jgi:hypothetical protein
MNRASMRTSSPSRMKRGVRLGGDHHAAEAPIVER